jgi:hypothetical protein
MSEPVSLLDILSKAVPRLTIHTISGTVFSFDSNSLSMGLQQTVLQKKVDKQMPLHVFTIWFNLAPVVFYIRGAGMAAHHLSQHDYGEACRAIQFPAVMIAKHSSFKSNRELIQFLRALSAHRSTALIPLPDVACTLQSGKGEGKKHNTIIRNMMHISSPVQRAAPLRGMRSRVLAR